MRFTPILHEYDPKRLLHIHVFQQCLSAVFSPMFSYAPMLHNNWQLQIPLLLKNGLQ
jgi:hypothetical protein